MSQAETSSAATTTSKDRMPHGAKARQLGVSTKTVGRWVNDGILDPPEYINGRMYHRADSQPRLDPGRLRRNPPPPRRGK
jgi:hypothetical protein